MKIKNIITAIFVLVAVACNNVNDEISPNNEISAKKSKVELISEYIANFHRKGLDKVYNALKVQQTRSVDLTLYDKDKIIVETINSMMEEELVQTRSSSLINVDSLSNDSVSIAMFTSISVEEIANNAIKIEKEYIDRFLNNLDDADDIKKIVLADEELSEENQIRILTFIDIYLDSTLYWSEHADEWADFAEKKRPQTRGLRLEFNLKEFVFADAWWGYQGLLSSGLNAYVGAGSAILGSACSCLR